MNNGSQGPAREETPTMDETREDTIARLLFESGYIKCAEWPDRAMTFRENVETALEQSFDAGAKSVVAAPQLEISQWIDTELWNFAHALALDLGLSHDAAGDKSKEESIHRSMAAVIGICLRMAGAAALPSAQNEWISVEERQPEKDARVLVLRSNDHPKIDIEWYQKRGAWDSGFWDEGEQDTNVTHWRELPSPPVPPVQMKKEK